MLVGGHGAGAGSNWTSAVLKWDERQDKFVPDPLGFRLEHNLMSGRDGAGLVDAGLVRKGCWKLL